MVAVVGEYATQASKVLGRRGFREKKNRGCVRGSQGDDVSVEWAMSARFFSILGNES